MSVSQRRISQDADNFASVFFSSRKTAEAVRAGRMDGKDASAIARNDHVGAKILGLDLQARIIERRLSIVDGDAKPAAIESQSVES